ncbi:hypothetical protein N9O97_02135 [Flavobacteriaceae bacterium]|nr:hypothetical protein [Flavobacteriaceae bacterium]
MKDVAAGAVFFAAIFALVTIYFIYSVKL